MQPVGIDLAAQPRKTGLVTLDWTTSPATVRTASTGATDEDLLQACRATDGAGGSVGIDCPLGWPHQFAAFLRAHAAGDPLPSLSADTRNLRLRATNILCMPTSGCTHSP